MLHIYLGNMNFMQVIVNFLKREADNSHQITLEWMLVPISMAELFSF